MQGIERTISDGIHPPGINDLLIRFNERVTAISQFQKITLKNKSNLPAVQKLDLKLAADIRRLLGETGHIARRLRVHYEHMVARIKDLMNNYPLIPLMDRFSVRMRCTQKRLMPPMVFEK